MDAIGGPKKLRTRCGPRPTLLECPDPYKHAIPPRTRVTISNLVALEQTAFGRWSPKILGTPWPRPLGMGRGFPLETCFSIPTCACYHAKFGHSRSNHTNVLQEVFLRRNHIWSLRFLQAVTHRLVSCVSRVHCLRPNV